MDEPSLYTFPSLVATVATVSAAILFFKISKGSKFGFQRNAVKHSFSNPLVGSVSILSNDDSVLGRDSVEGSIKGYEKLFRNGAHEDGSDLSNMKTRQKEYESMVNSFYDLVTDFYEWGWGQSFHFAPRRQGETFDESVYRLEHYLALRTGMDGSKKVLDVGCGVGGPMRNIAAFTGADITGVTINEYQVRVANKYNEQKGLDKSCRVIQGDFQKLPDYFEEETFDIAYAIEATCHSPDRKTCFSGVNKCLKKGGLFVGYDWVVLPERGYDSKNAEHVRIKEGIEVGNGLPTLTTPEEVLKAVEDAGFEIIESYDANKNMHSVHEIPWYQTLKGSMSLKGFRMTHVGRIVTHMMVNLLEFCRIAPNGSIRVSSLLNATAIDLVKGGEEDIFTPSFFFLAKKK